MRRRGHRAEANVIAAIAVVYFLYNAGYWLPFGGGTPGPRFLIPALPFLALGLAFAYRRFPRSRWALAIPSAVFMVAAALTFPLIGEQGTGTWADFARGRCSLEHTLLTAFGVAQRLACGRRRCSPRSPLAIVLAARATPRTQVDDLLARVLRGRSAGPRSRSLGPTIAGNEVTPARRRRERRSS